MVGDFDSFAAAVHGGDGPVVAMATACLVLATVGVLWKIRWGFGGNGPCRTVLI